MFKILFLCTGNRARSPVAEAYVRRLTSGLPVETSSAGLLDLGDIPALEEALRAARAAGLDLSAHRARCIANLSPADGDLVVGFERAHVAAAVVEHQVPADKVFGLAELVRLLESSQPVGGRDPEERARRAVRLAHEARRPDDFVPGEDVDDPYGQSSEAFTEMVDRVRGLSERLVTGLFVPGGEPRPGPASAG